MRFGDVTWTAESLLRSIRSARGRGRVGFLIPERAVAYDKAMASTRLRVYDIIRHFDTTPEFHAELYRPWNRYAVCVFQKFFDARAYRELQRLRARGARVLLDVNVNYFEPCTTDLVNEDHAADLRRFGAEVDGFITVSPFLRELAKEHFPETRATCIPENIGRQFFEKTRRHEDGDVVRLLFMGYAVKADAVLLIRDVLERLGASRPLEIVFLCDRDPGISLDGVATRFVRHVQGRLAEDVRRCDIKIAPRDLADPYNVGHAFTKIGCPMAAGLPVVASPVDSYRGSPAILCESPAEWERALTDLVSSADLRNRLGAEGVAHCRRHYTLDVVGRQYADLFRHLLRT